MKSIKIVLLTILFLASSIVFAQANAKMSDKVPFQKFLKFEDGGLLKEDAITAFKNEYNFKHIFDTTGYIYGYIWIN
jgi:hypothetical protein